MNPSEILRNFIKDALSSKASRVKKWESLPDSNLYSILKENMPIIKMMGIKISHLPFKTAPLKIESPTFPNNLIYIYSNDSINII